MSARRKVWQICWRLVICLGLLGWIFHAIFLNEARTAWTGHVPDWDTLGRLDRWRLAWQLGPPRLWTNLTVVSPGALAASFAVMGLTLLLGAFRWWIALRTQGLDLPWGRALRISLIAHFFNSFLLGSTGGDLMKAYYAARETAHRKPEAVVTVFVDRVIGLWTMLFFAGTMVLFNVGLIAAHETLRLLLLVILALLLAGTAFVALAFVGGLSRQLHGARDWLRRLPKGDWLDRSLETCRAFGRNRRFFLRMVIISMALNAVCVLQYLVLAAGMGIDLPFRVWAVVVPSIICVAALPITPSGLGVRENLYVAVLAATPLHVPETSALAVSLLAYAGSLFWSTVGGGVYFFYRDREHLEEVIEASPEVDSDANGSPSP